MVIMNRLSTTERACVVASLVEGNSIRATVRMTGIAKNTIVKLIAELGGACSQYQDETIRNIRSKRVQCDEIWSFVGAKKRTRRLRRRGRLRRLWTWTALDADSKLILSFRLGDRTLNTAYDFMHDLAARLANRVQLTTDGHRVYLEAVESAFNEEIDYAMLVKVYGQSRRRHALRPAECIGCATQDDQRHARPETRQHVLRRTRRTSRCGCRCAGLPA